jgi:hypothetical protein
VVWVNTSSRVYHLQGDKYFGATKHGGYMCESKADASGYHLAKGSLASPGPAASPAAKHHRHKKGTSPTEMSSPAPGATPRGKHHRHRATASPSPSAM